MKLIKARSNRAPAPKYNGNRAPVILAARSKSRIPSIWPKSQCALGSNPNSGGSPTVVITGLSVSSFPFGTDACGRFGNPNRILSSCSCFAARFLSSSFIWVATSRILVTRTSAFSPAFFISAIWSETTLRWCLRVSISCKIIRRSSSHFWNPFRSAVCPRAFIAFRTSDKFCLTNLISSIIILILNTYSLFSITIPEDSEKMPYSHLDAGIAGRFTFTHCRCRS